MRVLFTIPPGLGHFHPMAALAQALLRSGHEVRFACPQSFCPTVEAAGFICTPAGLDFREMMARDLPPDVDPRQLMIERLRTATSRVADTNPAAPSPHLQFIGKFMTTLITAASEKTVPDLLALATTWKPDVIVRSPLSFDGYLAAEVLAIPHVTAGFTLPQTAEQLQHLIGDTLQATRRKYGLAPDADLTGLNRYLYLSFAPPSFQPMTPQIPTLHYIRPVAEDALGAERLPAWIAKLPPRPTVCVTLGTVFNQARMVFELVLSGLRDQPYTLILTIGRENDPADLGPQPENVHIERYIPLSLLLPHCEVVVAHGGFNTTMAALRYGVPLLVLPISADQPINAQRCAEVGVGLTLNPFTMQPEDVRRAVQALIEQPDYRTRAEDLQREIAALPGPDAVVPLLRRVATEKQPVIGGT